VSDSMELCMEHAGRCLASANILFKDGDYAGTINRLYYCVFHSVRALLSNDSVAFKEAKIGNANYFMRKINEYLLQCR
jgi:uncharacterized protein (UPF0332 family)